MISYVTVTNTYGNSLQLSLFDASNGYVVESIDGLGPVEADIVSTDYANFDGVQYQNARRSSRNIVFKIGYLASPGSTTGYGLRNAIENLFRTKMYVTMKFTMSDRIPSWNISGYVESNETTRYDESPTTTISIICPDPDFVSSNSSGVYYSDNTHYPATLNVDGTEPVGFSIAIGIESEITTLSLRTVYDANNTTTTSKISLSGTLGTTSDVKLDTRLASRGIMQGSTSLLSMVQTGSVWPQLYPGDNMITFDDGLWAIGETDIYYVAKAGYL